ncbi:cation-translocating P-type ATPase [Sinisalibacter lacisalsi]|uniref:Calcium-transporting P-type ATPase, PMR1-type n=1 Tax=Sinisalibacter lacisalsi TaxID=1526570 RepID=A0ABQ1QIL2_9RHOB|nr:cation-transporting P-type ATPase [Sinisalibacter lacisalsi]GGD27905.1 calcium-transporting P-type ATPase, PMR1-type [Sinisalibacter lacisalsi]
MARPVEKAHTRSVEEVAKALDTDPKTGLGTKAVRLRQQRYGPNRLRKHEKKSALRILLHQFDGFIVWLLAAAAAMSFALGDLAEGIAIAVVLAINGAIGFFTELRAARSMEALQSIAEIRTRVRRDGAETHVDARELVPGDVVILEAGDVVTADLRLAEAANLHSDESVLTGESVPVAKATDATAPEAVIGDRSGMAFKGAAITQGTGEGIVVATGMETEIGHISDLAQGARGEAPPLERRLDRLGHRLVWLTLVLAALTVGLGILRGHELAEMIQTGIALAVAAVPEGLPVVATLSLARGMWRMARRNALITRLSSVETLGATTIILTDKTGTLTENRMTAVRYLIAGQDVEAEPEDEGLRFEADGARLSPEDDARLGWALRIGALCNNASLGEGKDGRAGDPMEIALLAAARDAGRGREALVDPCEQVGEHPFDPDLKMMATVHADEDGYVFAVKGAPEAVIAACEAELGPDGPRALDNEGRAVWVERNATAAGEGLRLLALAMKRAETSDAEPYRGLTLVGLVCLQDPLREDVTEAIRASRRAGVRVVMLTGDHADTAATIAREAGLGYGALTVIEGHELLEVDAETADQATRDRLLAADVFARVAPATKLNLVALYQQAGHVVAMTGDGVNDAPALKKADIGIAMGERGTQVAREAAHMVLKDDAFATIIAAMRQGRVIFDNIRKFVIYLMSCNVSELLVVGLAVGAGLPSPLLPLQILFLNLVTDVFPAFALGLGKGDEEVMTQPPRDPAESILNRPRWLLIGFLGAAITLATLAAFAIALFGLKLAAAPAVTVAFLTLALAQLWNVFNVRSPASGLFRNDVTGNPYVWGALALCLGLIAAALWLPGLSDLLGLPDPGLPGLILAAGMSLLPLVGGQILLQAMGPDWLMPHGLAEDDSARPVPADSARR